MSVTPFNVMGSDLNVHDKDARWWSTPYEYHNKPFTGFSHVNLSGAGCPTSAFTVMPTSGTSFSNYKSYGSEYARKGTPWLLHQRSNQIWHPHRGDLPQFALASRFTFPKGESHILLNLGEGLTNESGATIRRVSDTS